MSGVRATGFAAACLVLFVLAAGCGQREEVVHLGSRDPADEARVGEAIRRVFETRFDELSVPNRSHFAVRLYRITGEPRHLDAVAEDITERAAGFLETVRRLDEPGYIERTSEALWLRKPMDTPTEQARRKMFESRKESLFHRRVLFTASKLKAYGVQDEPAFRDAYARAVQYLSGVDFRPFLLDREVIRCYAAQASNMVYWLRGIGVVDLEREYVRAFREAFPDGEDESLPEYEYQAKLYGMTHLIIGDSGYYQRFVDDEKVDWILDYFGHNVHRILSWAKADVIAEVGLCFKLCGREDGPEVGLVKAWLREAYDPGLGYIPAVAENGTFDAAEHRNTVAYLLLKDFPSLYPGPDLDADDLAPFARAVGGRGGT